MSARLVLGIESSCDETGVALVEMHEAGVPTLLAHALYSQIDMHQAYGGVVPELASRDRQSKYSFGGIKQSEIADRQNGGDGEETQEG